MAENQTSEALDILLVAGLGNPGAEYAATRHNAGFRVADELAKRHGASYWKSECGCATTRIRLGGREVIIAKPLSYMNSSGGPLKKLADAHSIPIQAILVVHDELDIPAGDVRAKYAGGHAGHNGLRSIIEKFGSRDFSRIRTGIGRPPGRQAPVDYVLREPKGEDAELFESAVLTAADACEMAIMDGIDRTRDKYNGLHRA